MKDYYSSIAKGYNQLHQKEQLAKLEIIKKHLKVQEPLLDIGAGTGISTSFFKVRAVALDPSEGMLKQYKGEKVLASAEKIPFEDGKFGTVISVTALHHVDIDAAIKEIKRVARKDATFAFTILRKAKDFETIRKRLHANFDLKEYESEKDLILVS